MFVFMLALNCIINSVVFCCCFSRTLGIELLDLKKEVIF